MTPKVSVVIPVFNHAEALAECLRSLAKQTFKDFEIIVIDDGSAEPIVISSEAEKSLPNRDPSTSLRSARDDVQLIRFEKNKGAPAARNEGFRRAGGEYVMFLDADAVLRPDALEKMMKALDVHPEADFAYPSFRFGWKTFRGRPFDEKALQSSNYIHTSALIRRDAFPGFDESLKKFQDWDLFLTMAERGSRGVWIDEVLFSLKAGGTISNWMPRIAYQIPWPLFGWTPKTIRRYREAEKVIREKHGLQATGPASAASSAGWLVLILLIEALSVIAAFNPAASSVFAVLAGMAMFVGTILRPEAGFAVVVAEHVIGSKGRQFAFGADASHDGGISLRIILFASFFAGWFVHLFVARRAPNLRAMLEGRLAWVVLGGFILIGVVQGFLRGNSFLFADANAWGAFLLLVPALDLAQQHVDDLRRIVSNAVKIAIAWVSAKTLALFYFFSHDFGAAWEPVYLWVRRTGVGEVTRIVQNASAYRVFFQSHVYQVLAALGVMMHVAQRPSRIVTADALKALAILTAVIVISFSRSFWIGLAAGFFFVASIILRRKSWTVVPKLALSGAGGLLIVFALFMFPFPPSAGNLGDAILARADTGESAAQSRWELLPVLNGEILGSPLVGYGFGKTVTYRSSDPRVVAATGGEYTTYAFEWGWHDMAIKIGLLGVLAYAWVIVRLLRRLGSEHRAWQIAILSLCVIHVFTPYLNHPLGILVLVLAETLTVRRLDVGSRMT